MTVTLKKGRGYFKPENYTVRFTKEGFQPRELKCEGEVNGWYFGNIIFGGLIGLLAVDPATGAMYTLKPDDGRRDAGCPEGVTHDGEPVADGDPARRGRSARRYGINWSRLASN